jgi:hypothetical protein
MYMYDYLTWTESAIPAKRTLSLLNRMRPFCVDLLRLTQQVGAIQPLSDPEKGHPRCSDCKALQAQQTLAQISTCTTDAMLRTRADILGSY